VTIPEPRRSVRARAAAVGAAVLALVLLASLAGHHPAWSTGVGRRPLISEASNLMVTVFLLALAAAFIASYVRLLRQRPRFTRPELVIAIALLTAIVVATLLAVYGPRFGTNPPRDFPPGHQFPGGGRPGGAGKSDAGGLHVRWIFGLPMIGLLLLAAGFFALARRRRTPAPVIAEPVAEAVVAVLDDTLDDLRGERDPRRAVIATYARMEDVLAAHGLARRPAETPYEYLARVLTDLRASEESARRLTELFEWAKFSTHDVTERMRLDAIRCLTRLRDEIRSSAAEAPFVMLRPAQEMRP
jgi:Domain of unknown function (DUF4129)